MSLPRLSTLYLFAGAMMIQLIAPPAVMLAQEVPVEVYAVEEADGSYGVYANNHHIIPVYLRVDTPSITNLSSDRELPVSLGLEAGATAVPLFTLTPTRSTGRRGYTLSYTYAQGNPDTAHHDDTYLYLVPFEHGEKHRLSQGFHGAFSHFADNEYAVDFEMEIGTGVYAARGGTVAETRADSTVGGPSASYGDDANYILVLHDDGSFGNYVHLMTNGIVVAPGDTVVPGQLIGYSGNTGRSSGPHLHFDVRLPTYEGTMQSVPFNFRGRDGVSVRPEEGAFSYAYHPGKPEFEENYGREITLESYAGYREPINGPAALDTRVEQVDLTFLIFVQNGFAEDSDVEIRFRLVGLQSDAGATVALTAPAKSEVLATILRPLPGATTIQYSYTISYTR